MIKLAIETKVILFMILVSIITVAIGAWIPVKVTVYNAIITEDEDKIWYLVSEGVQNG